MGAIRPEIRELVVDVVLADVAAMVDFETDAIRDGESRSLGPGLASNAWFSKLDENGGGGGGWGSRVVGMGVGGSSGGWGRW